ncbi:unnamed protein product [Arabis nemorensis]|uniref:Uncharacterized protein n=1 Tax=Arabis nemorensis TaxID=586526 RepID=A0A565ARJ4_9BRAS|nr:unnamed protein product [Arabis nemorensis]
MYFQIKANYDLALPDVDDVLSEDPDVEDLDDEEEETDSDDNDAYYSPREKEEETWKELLKPEFVQSKTGASAMSPKIEKSTQIRASMVLQAHVFAYSEDTGPKSGDKIGITNPTTSLDLQHISGSTGKGKFMGCIGSCGQVVVKMRQGRDLSETAFVQGCVASILLDDSATVSSEKSAVPNKNSVIDEIKSKLEEESIKLWAAEISASRSLALHFPLTQRLIDKAYN